MSLSILIKVFSIVCFIFSGISLFFLVRSSYKTMVKNTALTAKVRQLENQLKDLTFEYNVMMGQSIMNQSNRKFTYDVDYRLLYNQSLTAVSNLMLRIKALEAEKRLYANAAYGNQQFTDDEIKSMIRLCHPDKHGGKESAVIITQKLLSMRR